MRETSTMACLGAWPAKARAASDADLWSHLSARNSCAPCPIMRLKMLFTVEVIAMAIIDQSGLKGKIRDREITATLSQVLEKAADAAGIDVVRVVSGGQPGSSGRRTGSTRHDGGRAADLQVVKGGQVLTFTDEDGGPVIEAFVAAAAANGATGIGAGVRYMGDSTLHVGFGTTPKDHSKVVWGAGGRSANAPRWLRIAAQKGWDHPVGDVAAAESLGRFVVAARGGMQLRKGPGADFGVTKTLEPGTPVNVVGFDGRDGEWARVDLAGDGWIDGHLHSAFLRPEASELDKVAEGTNGE
jgi:hypothetical protein